MTALLGLEKRSETDVPSAPYLFVRNRIFDLTETFHRLRDPRGARYPTIMRTTVLRPLVLATWVIACGAGIALPTTSSAAEGHDGARPRLTEDSPPPSPKAETDNYSVEIRPVGTYTKDQEGVVEVVIQTKGEYHINDQYPYKFSPKERDGVTHKGPVGREGGQFEKTRAVLRISFTPTKTGSVTIAGKVSVSACSEKNCLVQKHDLELTITVN